MPAISLIIPLYNAEKYLRPCLDSAKNQTFEDIEIICINDGSTDNTADIVNEYVAEDSRFRLIEQENAGCSMARNHGLKSAMSPYVALLDQDDVLHPQAMEVLHHLITKYNADVAEFVNETVPDDFVVLFALINHFHNADRLSPHDRQRQNRFLSQNQNIQRVVIIAVSLRNKPVVGRIMHRAVKNAVNFKQAAQFIQFIFNIRAAGNFNHRGYHFGEVFPAADAVPWVQHAYFPHHLC